MGFGALSRVVREVPWPDDVAAVAQSLSNSDAWCWLDGASDNPAELSRVSYLAEAAEVRHADPLREKQFLAGLRASPAQWVVSFSYEFGVALLGEPAAQDSEPRASALRCDVVLVLDHRQRRAELRGPSERVIDAWWGVHGSSFAAPENSASGVSTAVPGDEDWRLSASAQHPRSAQWRQSEERYAAQVEVCRREIHDGNAYVLCLTDTATVQGQVDPLALYRRLRAHGPALRGGLIVIGHRALVSMSPERFLSVRGRQVETHPIKGTRPRGRNTLHDDQLAADLAADAKERAENLMIVDLMRNDLARVCEPGSVRVERFLRVERHLHVHQLVSTVSGQLAQGNDVYAALEASFPGGSMTGAPKVSAVRILASLEAGPRGWYSGCFGWIDASGDAELAMTIRAVELRNMGASGACALIGSGGGLTAESDAAQELAEQRHKAHAQLVALGVDAREQR